MLMLILILMMIIIIKNIIYYGNKCLWFRIEYKHILMIYLFYNIYMYIYECQKNVRLNTIKYSKK